MLLLPAAETQVYAQIPDLMILDLYIASPVLVVPGSKDQDEVVRWLDGFCKGGWPQKMSSEVLV